MFCLFLCIFILELSLMYAFFLQLEGQNYTTHKCQFYECVLAECGQLACQAFNTSDSFDFFYITFSVINLLLCINQPSSLF